MKTEELENQCGIKIGLETNRLPRWAKWSIEEASFDAGFRNNIFSIQDPFNGVPVWKLKVICRRRTNKISKEIHNSMEVLKTKKVLAVISMLKLEFFKVASAGWAGLPLSALLRGHYIPASKKNTPKISGATDIPSLT